jgi:DNA polymerase gamma 1
VKSPLGNIIFFDVELHMGSNHNQFPYLAICLTELGWFSWTSPYISDPDLMNANYDNEDLMNKLTENRLISFGKDLDQEKLVIGHNIGFDRIRILEEYNPDESKLRFFDTLSMHCCVSGISSQQIIDYVDEMKKIEENSSHLK